MRGTTQTIHCDADDGYCSNWAVDHYGACASSVGGVRVTEQQRAPGWFNGPRGDFCPDHATTTKEN